MPSIHGLISSKLYEGTIDALSLNPSLLTVCCQGSTTADVLVSGTTERKRKAVRKVKNGPRSLQLL